MNIAGTLTSKGIGKTTEAASFLQKTFQHPIAQAVWVVLVCTTIQNLLTT